MARINIEDCWWTDPRRSLLVQKTGSETNADGAIIKAWRLAQQFWKVGKGLIPVELFETLPFHQELLDSKLATVRNAFVYVRGSSEYLDWVREKIESAKIAGQKSAEARKKKNGTAQPKPNKKAKTPKNVEPNSNDSRTESNDAEPSSSSSSSSSNSLSVVAEIQTTATKNFDSRFNTEWPEISTFLKSLKLFSLTKKPDQVMSRFENVIVLKDFITGVLGNKAIENASPHATKNYIYTAIARECGVICEA